MFAVALMPPVENWAGDEDGGKGARYDADHEDKGEVVDDPCPENPQGECCHESRDAGQNGAREYPVDGDDDDLS